MCKHAHPHSNTEPDNFFLTGFIRINPSTAPLNPPGAAPTLTTISEEVAPPHTSSTTTSPSDSLPKEPSALKDKSKRRKRLNRFGAKAAKEGVIGTEKEKQRTQTIADSLDLGGDLQVDEIDETRVGESGETIERRKMVAMETGSRSAP